MLLLLSAEHSTYELLLLFPIPQTLFSATVALYGPTKKCGNANTNDPMPIMTTPQPTHFSFDEPIRPPK